MKGLLIFDLDGTLLDTLDDLAASLNYALTCCGLPARSRDEVQSFIGNGVRLLVRRALPESADAETEQRVFAAFADRYREHCADLTRPYAGVEDMLRQVRQAGFATAVVSNKSHREVQALCRRFFPGLLDMAAGERPGLARKPAPDLPRLVLEELGFRPEQACYIGDSPVDIETAVNAGTDCVCVSWGFRSRRELIRAGAVRIADSPAALAALLVAERD